MSDSAPEALVTVFLLVVFAWIAMSRLKVLQRIRYRGFEKWPLFRATVQSQSTTAAPAKGGTIYRAEVAYSYIYQGQYYSGYLKLWSRDEDEINEFLELYRVDSKFEVHVNPNKPEQSTVSIELL